MARLSAKGPAHFVKWYPPRWRSRYGEELVAILEDTYGGGRIPPSRRLEIVRAGVSERFHELGLGARDRTPIEQVRTGSLLVLWAWAVFVVTGAAFAKMIENWDVAAPRADRWLPIGAVATVQWAAGIGAIVVLAAAGVAFPAFARRLPDGGWTQVRGPIRRAVAMASATLLLTFGMIVWAHHVGPAHGNGGLGPHPVGVFWALMVTSSIGTCTCTCTCTYAAASVARRLRLSPLVLRLEGLLALLLTSAMITIVGGMLVWCGAIATDAPGLLSGNALGLFGAPAAPAMIAVGLLAPAGLLLAVGGAGRVAGSIRAVRPE